MYKKQENQDWEATVLISNRLPQLNDCNKILTELFIQKSKADILDNRIKHSQAKKAEGKNMRKKMKKKCRGKEKKNENI